MTSPGRTSLDVTARFSLPCSLDLQVPVWRLNGTDNQLPDAVDRRALERLGLRGCVSIGAS